jgi:hypothetical protein
VSLSRHSSAADKGENWGVARDTGAGSATPPRRDGELVRPKGRQEKGTYIVKLSSEDQHRHFDVGEDVGVDWGVVEPGHEVDQVVPGVAGTVCERASLVSLRKRVKASSLEP